MPKKLLIPVSFLYLVIIGFLIFAYFSPSSPLSKKSRTTISSILSQPTPSIALVRFKKGDEEFTAGPKCSGLFKIIQNLREKDIFEAGKEVKFKEIKFKYSLIADTNRDGEVNYTDWTSIIKNMRNEEWCSGILLKTSK